MGPVTAAGQAPVSNVTIDLGKLGATVPGTAVGLNAAVWDSHLQDPEVPGLLRDAGVTLLRFPGGSTADQYHWQTNSITPQSQRAGKETPSAVRCP
jgi:hypothetical protein